MARPAKSAGTPTSTASVAHGPSTGHAAEPPTHGIGSARAWVSGSLGAAHSAADWLEQWQRFGLEGVASLSESLAAAAREAERAEDPFTLMGMPSQIIGQQLQEMTRQFGLVMQESLKAQTRWAEQLRRQGGESGAPSSGNGAAGPLLGPAANAEAAWKSLGQVQDEWLAVTQRWLDAVNAATVQRARN